MNINKFYLDKIRKYFKKDYSYKNIVLLMAKKYNVYISARTFERLMNILKLKRKNITESPLNDVVLAIMVELQGSGFNLGYRAMWKRLRIKYNLTIKQKTVMYALQIIDSDGVEGRCKYRLKRRQYGVPGPMYVIHADGHDKLKRFGFAIYGFIDGHSKKVLSLEVASTNNNPAVIGYQYLTMVKKIGFLPTLLRTDHGTETKVMEGAHIALRFHHVDENAGIKSYIKGKSTHNQRIESWWRQLRQHTLDFYINLFKSMEYKGYLDISNKLHIESLRYCYGDLIKEDLKLTLKEWNEHTIRKQNGRNFSGYKPNELFHFPTKVGKHFCGKPVNMENLDTLLEEYTEKPRLYLQEVEKFVSLFITKDKPKNAEEAFYLYLRVVNAVAPKNIL